MTDQREMRPDPSGSQRTQKRLEELEAENDALTERLRIAEDTIINLTRLLELARGLR